MTLSVLGKQGLRETAVQCLSKAEYLKAGVKAIPGPFSVAFSGRTFNEFALRCGVPVDEVLRRAEEKKILAGVPFARLDPRGARLPRPPPRRGHGADAAQRARRASSTS